MNVTCPKCGLAILRKLRRIRCPRCKALLNDIPESPSEHNAPAPAPARDLLDEILDEIRQFRAAQSAAPYLQTALAGAAVAAPAVSSFTVRRVPPAPPRNWGHTVAVVCGIVLILAAAAAAVHFVRINLQEETARRALQRASPRITLIKSALDKGDKAVEAKDFRTALAAFREVKSRALPLVQALRADTENLRPGRTGKRVAEIIAQVNEYVARARQALEDGEIERRGRGLVKFDGEWVTPEKKQQLFEAKMRRGGRRLYKGRWLTEEDIHELKGEVFHNGQWVKKEDLPGILAEEKKRGVPRRPRRRRARPTPAPSQRDPRERKWFLDDFDKDALLWTNVTWGNVNSCGLATDQRNDSGVLLINMKGGRNDKSAIVRKLDLDFTSRTRLNMDILNECGEPIKIAIALETNMYHESRWIPLKIGMNKGVNFDLRAGDFKSAATHWAHAARIAKPERAGFLYILIYFNRPGKIAIDNLVAFGGR